MDVMNPRGFWLRLGGRDVWVPALKTTPYRAPRLRGFKESIMAQRCVQCNKVIAEDPRSYDPTVRRCDKCGKSPEPSLAGDHKAATLENDRLLEMAAEAHRVAVAEGQREDAGDALTEAREHLEEVADSLTKGKVIDPYPTADAVETPAKPPRKRARARVSDAARAVPPAPERPAPPAPPLTSAPSLVSPSGDLIS